MSKSIHVTQDTWFDPFSTNRPRPPARAAAHGGTVQGWQPAAVMCDPGDDPSHDPDPQARR